MYSQECRCVCSVSKHHWLRSVLSPYPNVDEWIRETRGDPAGGRMQEDDTRRWTEDRLLSQKSLEGRRKRKTGSDKTGRSGLHIKLH